MTAFNPMKLVPQAALCGSVTMTRISFEAMSLDDLWNLHERVVSILEKRLDHERQKREHQLKELGRKFGWGTFRYEGTPTVSEGPAEVL